MSNFLRSQALAAIERIGGSKFWSIYLRQQKDRHDAREQQIDLLNQLVRHAAETVPHWNEQLEHLRSRNVDITSIPVLTKSLVQKGFPSRITSSQNRDDWRFGQSSGTVDRVNVVSDFKKRDYLRATNLRVVNDLLGSPLAARIVDIRPESSGKYSIFRPLREQYVHGS